MKDLLAAGLLIQIFAPFLVTCIFTLLGFFFGRWWGRRQGYAAGWYDRGLAGKPDPASYCNPGVQQKDGDQDA